MTAEGSEVTHVLDGHKFAVLAVPESRAGQCPKPALNLHSGFAMSRGLPPEALKTWSTELGSIHLRELDATRLFLWALRPSATARILDEENRALQERVYQLYLGLLVAVPYFSNGRLTSMTGANVGGFSRVRSLTWFDRNWFTVGTPATPLNTRRIQDALSVARALIRHPDRHTHRMVRALRTFRKAVETRELDDRLHQFVRVIEAFAGCDGGGEFADRIGHFVTGAWARESLVEIYAIRGSIEHLRGPYGSMGMTRRKKGRGRTSGRVDGGYYRRLIRRTIEAETIARYLLFQYFTRPKLWKSFQSARAASDFWISSSRDALLREFGDPIPLRHVASAIKWDEVVRIRERFGN